MCQGGWIVEGCDDASNGRVRLGRVEGEGEGKYKRRFWDWMGEQYERIDETRGREHSSQVLAAE